MVFSICDFGLVDVALRLDLCLCLVAHVRGLEIILLDLKVVQLDASGRRGSGLVLLLLYHV
jgi:hypothetical protein